jgi:outer membrane protein OmpA-like peptidoglycan-associated protein
MRYTFFAALAPVLLVIFALPATAQVDLTRGATDDNVKAYTEFVKKKAPSEDAFIAVQLIAEREIHAHQWKDAAKIFRQFLPYFKGDKRYAATIRILEAREEGLRAINLGPNINTSADEYLPVLAADGKRLYFTGNERYGGYGGEDIFYSDRRDSIFGPATNLSGQINTTTNEASLSISTDGNRLIIFGNYPESYGRGDIFYTDRTANGWSRVQHFPRPINSEYYDCDAIMTSDGKAMLFVSDRPGGIGDYHGKGSFFHGNLWGNSDIYVSVYSDSGWSKPINLGPTINTPYAERTPFLHPDGKTLYFSSDGHGGLGRLDVYKSTRLREDSWTEWSTPVNLGKEVNTEADDRSYRISTSGDVAYFATASRGDGLGGSDIYSVMLPTAARPEAVATIHGRVTDTKGNPLAVDINWQDLRTKKSLGTLKSNPQDGTYFIALPMGKEYGYYASRSGYYPVSHNVDLRKRKGSADITENIVLASIEELKSSDVAVRLNNIFFDYNTFQLQEESFPELDRLVSVIDSTPGARVEIDGYTDDQGSDSYNQELSVRRAQAVVDYLVAHGIPRNRLVPRGFGKSKPVATNDTDEGRAQNRRVEFRFLR